MSDAQHRFFGWNTNTDWAKCSSKDCIETIGVFAIDASEATNDFQGLCNLSNMIESDKASYDNGDISYGTTISFFNQIINFELEKDEKWWSNLNNFHQMLTTEKEETIGDVTISYKRDYFKMEFDGHMYTGMNFDLVSEDQGVEACTVFFGSDETLYLEELHTAQDTSKIMTDDDEAIAVTKAYGAQSIFLSKTGPLDYKPFCDKSLQFGIPEPEELLKERDEPLQPDVVLEPIEEEEIAPEVVDTSVLDALPLMMAFLGVTAHTVVNKVFIATMIGEPVTLPDEEAYKRRMHLEGFITSYDLDGAVTNIDLLRPNSDPLMFPLMLIGVNTGNVYNSIIKIV